MNKRIIYYLLFFFLLADLSYSFVQHLSMPLDGDMAGGIVPADDVKPVLNDPFGISVITENAVYPNPNRFFAHWTFYSYFNHVPLQLQKVVSPIDSVYLACAIVKIFIQVLILILISIYITGSKKMMSSQFLIVSVLIIPLFQTNGFGSHMAIIDPSITYTFFYSLPCAIILLFYLPFYLDSTNGTSYVKKWYFKFSLFLFIPFIVFNGALNPGIILTISLVLSLKYFSEADKKMSVMGRIRQALKLVPKSFLLPILLASLLSIYALYIGLNNSIFLTDPTTLGEKYSRVPVGIYKILTEKIGVPILIFMIILNIILLKWHFYSDEIKKTLTVFKWIGIFTFCYIALLPLGGFKEYRPHILRYDTIMPITISLIFMFGQSSYLLLKGFKGKEYHLYLSAIIGILVIFTVADKPGFSKNDFEKKALLEISNSEDKIVRLDMGNTILSWEKLTDPKKSELKGKLLRLWRITDEAKLFYQADDLMVQE